jgi:hypothetical protein
MIQTQVNFCFFFLLMKNVAWYVNIIIFLYLMISIILEFRQIFKIIKYNVTDQFEIYKNVKFIGKSI